MTLHRHVFVDVDGCESAGSGDIAQRLSARNACTLAGSADWSVSMRTLAGGQSTGVQVLDVATGAMTASLLITRGMGLWKVSLPDWDLKWDSPVPRPVHPAFVNLKERNGLGWLNGFNELLCRCGLGYNGPPCEDEGLDVTLHGRSANLPAHFVAVTIDDSGSGSILVEGVVDETTLFGPCFRLTSRYRFEAGSTVIELTDEVCNLGDTSARFSLLYHINIGAPMLAAGAEVTVPHVEMAPRDAAAVPGIDHYRTYDPPRVGYAEQAFYFQPAADERGWSTAVLAAADRSRAVGVSFDTRTLPWFVLWKNTVGSRDGYVTGLEPAVNFPNSRSFERTSGRLPELQPGACWSGSMKLWIANTSRDVEGLIRQAAQCQPSRSPQVHRTPRKGWSPSAD